MAIDLERFPTSESAKRMISYVSEEFYERAYVAKWLYQVMGLEWDDVWTVVETLPEQAFPETATWGLMYHEMKWGLPVRENLDYEERRRRIYQKRDLRAPMVPWRLEWYLRNATGHNIRIEDIHEEHLYGWTPPHPNVFKVYITDVEGTANTALLRARLNALKQSHTTYTVQERVSMEIDQSELERIEAFRMILHMAVDFWALPIFLDGSYLLDRSTLLGADKRYDLIPGLRLGYKLPRSPETVIMPGVKLGSRIETEERIGKAGMKLATEADFWRRFLLDGSHMLDGSARLDGGFQYDLIPGFKYRIPIQAQETINVPRIGLKTSFESGEELGKHGGTRITGWAAVWNRLFLDGGTLLDGERLLDGARRGMKTTMKVSVTVPKIEEAVGAATLVTKTRDYAFLNGSVSLDGSRRLNSIYREEEI
ncbi:MAG: DUF2313 domain-containing protein [Oscillospiraceae bacterium]|nr:DUF2313 domain-containing protein [Oscillospiraceae bacterium]